MSAQLLPASLMFFNLCSSAGVQGVLVRLFLAGGAIDEDILGSSKPEEEGPAIDELDCMLNAEVFEAVAGAAARLLFRALAGEGISDLSVDGSVVDGWLCEREKLALGSISCLSTRFDIG